MSQIDIKKHESVKILNFYRIFKHLKQIIIRDKKSFTLHDFACSLSRGKVCLHT